MLFWGALVLLVIPAAALTLVRLLGLDSATAVRLVSFAPLALPSYAAALVLLAVALLRRPARGGGGGRLLVAATAAVLVGLGLHAWWLAPLVTVLLCGLMLAGTWYMTERMIESAKSRRIAEIQAIDAQYCQQRPGACQRPPDQNQQRR